MPVRRISFLPILRPSLRRTRVTALAGLACVFGYSIASAQVDSAWLGAALEQTRLSSAPWAMGSQSASESVDETIFPPAGSPTPNVLSASEPATATTVGSPPAEAEEQTEPTPHFSVALVDDFDDPWVGRARAELGATELVNPWPNEAAATTPLEGAAAPQLPDSGPVAPPAATGSTSKYQESLLVDPWGG